MFGAIKSLAWVVDDTYACPLMSRLHAIVLGLALSVGGLATIVVAEPIAHADKGAISIVDARKIALARVPGTIVHEKTKKKKHGHVIYNIKIKPRDAAAKSDLVKKVEIDATTGQIVKIKDAKAKANDD